MMVKSLVDMSRPHMLYSAGLGLIMLVSLAVSNIPALSLSQYIDFSHRKELCATLFILGAMLGAFSMHRHLLRARAPWRIPQSQVAIPYAGFFIFTLVGLLLAR